MYFQILQVILWRRGGNGRRSVRFEPGMVNVISGASKTGKSAMVPIIDYCLGSDRCAIPSGVIRESCEWFGILVDTAEGQKLIARREPGDQRQTGDMFILEASEVEVPDRIEEKNSTSTIAKSMLDRVAGLSNLGFEAEAGESGYRSRPSFRDLMAFTFQPQNIIANPDVLFFKADTTEHREKLKTIFPYVLNAVTPDDLAARFEIERLLRILRRKEGERAATLASVEVWRNEALAWLRQAIDLGLLVRDELPADWPDILDLLRSVAATTSRQAVPTIKSVEGGLARIEELRRQESAAADRLSESRQRLGELRRLLESSGQYGSAIRVQRDRLSISKWIKERSSQSGDVVAQIATSGRQKLDSLIEALEGTEIQLRSHPAISDTLNREQLRLRGEADGELEQLAAVRQEIAILERESKTAREAAYGFDRIERFLGRLQQAITIYDKADSNADLRLEIDEIRGRIDGLRGKLSDHEISRRIANAKSTVESYAASIVPSLNAEWRDAAIRLVIADLSIKVIRGIRDDYLWEIGSGANWLAFHIATTLSLQRFFLDTPHHPVPGMLVYDQPSQVYFPRRAADEDGYLKTELGDEDIFAVRQVFLALAAEVLKSKGRLQVIVLDHAGVEVWGDMEGVTLTEEWRDGVQKLVPAGWVDGSSDTAGSTP